MRDHCNTFSSMSTQLLAVDPIRDYCNTIFNLSIQLLVADLVRDYRNTVHTCTFHTYTPFLSTIDITHYSHTLYFSISFTSLAFHVHVYSHSIHTST